MVVIIGGPLSLFIVSTLFPYPNYVFFAFYLLWSERHSCSFLLHEHDIYVFGKKVREPDNIMFIHRIDKSKRQLPAA